MADVGFVSAGTFVASILETAGFMTQAKFLDDFQDFFREGGAFIYLVGAVGAVLSITMYGSYRAARYLLLGPALFYFLTGPRSQTDGAVWQIGGGSPRTPSGPASLDEAIARRDEVIRKATDGWNGAGASGGKINVATGFAIFAMTIDGVAKDMVDLFLAAEDGKDMTFVGKTRGYEILTMVLPEDSMFIEMLEQDFLVQCAPLMNAAIARSYINIQEQLSGTNASPEARTHRQGLKDLYDRDITRFLDTRDKFIGEASRRYIRAQHEQGRQGVSQQLVQDLNVPFPNISCGDYWRLVTEYLISIAEKKEREILFIAKADLKARAGAGQNLTDEEACKEIQRIIYGTKEEGAACKLKYTIALYMLKNQIGPQSSYSRLLKRHWNTQSMINPIRNNNLTPIRDTRGFTASTGADGGPIVRHRIVTQTGPNGQTYSSYVLEQQFVPTMTDPNARPQQREHWYEVVPHSGNQGPDHAMWVSTQRAQTVQLRQQMFTWALQLPYWQGMILYLISSMYPFLALLVLIPGRAPAFWNVPLAWLWAKSWDVGLAAVIVLDRVMWNMLPAHNLDDRLSADIWEPEQLVQALTEAFKLDPGFNIHMYYMLLSVALLSIPAVTGAMTLKAKRSILSTFADSLQSHSRDAGERRSNAFQLLLMDDRYADAAHAELVAVMRHTERGDGVAGGRRGMVGRTFAGANAIMDLGKNAPSDIGNALKSGQAPGAGKYGRMGAEAINKYASMTGTQASFEVGYARDFDPEVGRWGRIPMIQDAYASAMDGSGGYEIRNAAGSDQNAARAFITAFSEKAIEELKMVEKAIGTGLSLANNARLVPGELASAEAAALPRLLGGLTVGGGLLGLTVLNANRETEIEVEQTAEQRKLKSEIDVLQRAAGATELSNAEFLWEVFFIPPSRTEALVGREAAHEPVDRAALEAEIREGRGVTFPYVAQPNDFLGARIVEVNDPAARPGAVALEAAAQQEGLAAQIGIEAGAGLAMRGGRNALAAPENDELVSIGIFPSAGFGSWSTPSSWAFTPIRDDAEQRREDRQLFLRVGEIPVQLPAALEYLRQNHPEMADEAIEAYLRNVNEKHQDAVVAWNAQRQKALSEDDQYLYRLAKSRMGRSERDVQFADIFGRRRRWKLDADIDEDLT